MCVKTFRHTPTCPYTHTHTNIYIYIYIYIYLLTHSNSLATQRTQHLRPTDTTPTYKTGTPISSKGSSVTTSTLCPCKRHGAKRGSITLELSLQRLRTGMIRHVLFITSHVCVSRRMLSCFRALFLKYAVCWYSVAVAPSLLKLRVGMIFHLFVITSHMCVSLDGAIDIMDVSLHSFCSMLFASALRCVMF